MTQMLVAGSLLVGIVGLLWVLATIFQDNRRAHSKKIRTF
jgi:hypothetical protein